MIDFAKMEYGAIKSEDGVYIIVLGKMHGPFNGRQLDKIVDIMKLEVNANG